MFLQRHRTNQKAPHTQDNLDIGAPSHDALHNTIAQLVAGGYQSVLESKDTISQILAPLAAELKNKVTGLSS